MPGAGSLRAANYLFNVAPKDGTALGVVTQTVMLEAPLGTPGVKYNAIEFTYVGRMTGVLETMISWHEAKAKTIYDVRKYETIAGGTGPTSPTEGYPRLLNAFAGTKFRIMSGFGGTVRDHARDGAARSRRAGEFLELDRAHQEGVARRQEDQRADPGGTRALKGTARHADAGGDGQHAARTRRRSPSTPRPPR